MLDNIEAHYILLLKKILKHGNETSDRTGTGTISLFGEQIRHDFQTGFPLLTTKKIFWKGVVEELLWILRGETNVKSLQDKGVNIWNEWADENGELGPVYGKQWRAWPYFHSVGFNESEGNIIGAQPCFSTYAELDQIANLIKRIKEKPDCRRLIVSAWNAPYIDLMKLPPCHCFFQFKVYGDKLYCQLYQRSADAFLGVPFNIASYALLTMIIADITGLKAAGFIHTFGDIHIYKNHIDQVVEQVSRLQDRLPIVYLTKKLELDCLKFEDFKLKGYNPAPTIKAKVSV